MALLALFPIINPVGAVASFATLTADLPKKVEWDQALLANLDARIAANGDNPREFIDVSYRVSETKFSAWASALREQFIPARTVKVGKPSFRLALLSE